MKHNFWRGAICGVTLGFVVTAARADTITVTPSPFSIARNGIVQSTTSEFVDQGEATYGGQRAQGVFTLDGRWVYWSAIEGIPCSCRPGWQWDAYYLDNFEPLGWIAGQNAQVLVTLAGDFLIIDGQPVRTHAGDWNGDGTTSVQDIFDFLTDSFAGNTTITVADFLADYFTPQTTPPPIGCPCLLSDYPLVLIPQGPASDGCYEDYKYRTLEAYNRFLDRVYRDCRIEGTTCWRCSCVLSRWLEWQIEDRELWEACE